VKLRFKKLTSGENLIEPPISQVDKILASLQAKIRLAFKDEDDLLRWMNLSETNMVRPEEFWFGIQYFFAEVTPN
jgi:hypothetical protein